MFLKKEESKNDARGEWLQSSAKTTDPQSFNRYSYVVNSPLKFIDPSGMSFQPGGRNISNWNGAMASEQATEGISPWPEETEPAAAAPEHENANGGDAGAEEHERAQNAPEDPPTDNRPTIDNGTAPNQACTVQVSFTGSYYGLENGPSVPMSPQGPVYGIGFSVSISGLSGDVAVRSGEQDPKPKNTWLVEQWVAGYTTRNGSVVRQDTAGRMDPLGRAVPRPRSDGNTVSWWDHPGTPAAGTQSYFTKRNFYVKAYNGKKHCEVAFHLTFRVFRGQIVDPGWGRGMYK